MPGTMSAQKQRGSRHPAAYGLLIGALILLLGGATALGALQAWMLPPFQHIVAVGRHALVVEHGPFCVPETPLPRCKSAIVREELRVVYLSPQERHTLLSVVRRR